MGDPKITWRQAQKRLDSSQIIMLNQIARMKENQKENWAAFHRNDYKSTNKAWQALARKNPEQRERIKAAQRLAQLKMVFGKNAINKEQYKEISAYLKTLEAAGDDFGRYWGY